MSNQTIIQTSESKAVGSLVFRDMTSPSWIPVKADCWNPVNDLYILSLDQTTSGRFFTDRFAASSDGRYIFLEEKEFDGSQDSIDKNSSRLVLIDTIDAKEAFVGRIDDGHCFPKSVNDVKVCYQKMKRTETGVYREFDRDLASLVWTRLGEQGES